MKKNLIFVAITLLVMCVCESGYAQNFEELDTTNFETFQESLKKIEKKKRSMSAEMLDYYNYAGQTYTRGFGLYSDEYYFGFSCYEKALAIYKKYHGENSSAAGIGYLQLAAACGAYLDKTKLYADSALAILRPIYGEQSHEVAMVYLTLASSYYLNNDEICRVAAQGMMIRNSEYFIVPDYEEIISNLENSIKYYRIASDIYSHLDDKYKYKIDLIKDCIDYNEEEIKYYKQELEEARKEDI